MKLLLDSGAFSADSQGKSLLLGDYIEYVQDNKRWLDHYIVLDVIKNSRLSWNNQKMMERRNLEPLPVFHSEDKFPYYLDKCLEYDYFALGGMAGGSAKSMERRVSFLNKCWKHILKKKPEVKVHGLGMASFILMGKYPWYSVDTTSWTGYGWWGNIVFPVDGGRIHRCKVTLKCKALEEGEEHLYNLPQNLQNACLESIRSFGYDMGESEIVFMPPDYKPRGNESWIGKIIEEKKVQGFKKCKKQQNVGLRMMEKVVKPGLMNSGWLRDKFNYEVYYDLMKKHDTILWYAGNFVWMKQLQKERRMLKYAMKKYGEYRRLITFYYREESDNLIKVRREWELKNKRTN